MLVFPAEPPQPHRKKRNFTKLRSRAKTVAILILIVAVVAVGHGLITSKLLRAAHDALVYTKPQTVCLDPGHGGQDPGATNGNITERDINLIVAQKVRSSLESQGYRVFMTRTTNDPTLSNHDRYTYCNSQHATIMVAIHHNFYTDDTVDYDTALFYKDSDQALATSILNATATKLNITNDGIAQFDDGVLSESTMPAALSEAFFMTDTDEYNQLTAPNSPRLSDEAAGITTGIMNYFTQPKQAPAINANPQVINRND